MWLLTLTHLRIVFLILMSLFITLIQLFCSLVIDSSLLFFILFYLYHFQSHSLFLILYTRLFLVYPLCKKCFLFFVCISKKKNVNRIDCPGPLSGLLIYISGALAERVNPQVRRASWFM